MRWLVVLGLIALVMLSTIDLVRAETSTQLYWYYYLDSAQGSCKAVLDNIEKYPTWYPGGSLVGGQWVTLEPGKHTLTLVYHIEEDRVVAEQDAEKPICVVRLGDSEPTAPPNMPGFYEGHFWILSIKHPWVWDSNYSTITWNSEPMREYKVSAVITINPDGTIEISGDGYGNLGEYVPTNETSTTTPATTTTTTTTTVTSSSGTETTATTVNVIGTVADTVRSNPAAAIAAGAGLAGLLGIVLVALRR